MDDHFEAIFRTQAAADGVTHFCTGIAVVRDNKLLVVHRVPEDEFGDLYEIPGGGVDSDETFPAAARREALEETGLQVVLTGMFPGFDYATSSKPKVRQINYLARMADGQQEVVLEPSEHDMYAWINREEVETIRTSDAMRTCLRSVFEALAIHAKADI